MSQAFAIPWKNTAARYLFEFVLVVAFIYLIFIRERYAKLTELPLPWLVATYSWLNIKTFSLRVNRRLLFRPIGLILSSNAIINNRRNVTLFRQNRTNAVVNVVRVLNA